MGRKAIAATTIAIESVVLRHLADQRAQLVAVDPLAAELIASIVEDEQLHHDSSYDEIDVDSVLLRSLRSIVGGSTELVIWLGMKL